MWARFVNNILAGGSYGTDSIEKNEEAVKLFYHD